MDDQIHWTKKCPTHLETWHEFHIVLLRGGTYRFFFIGGQQFHLVPTRYHSKVFKNLLPRFWYQIKPLGGAIPKMTSLWPSALGSLFWECPTLGLYPAHNVGPGNSIGMQIEIWWSGLRIAGEILPHVMMVWCDDDMMWATWFLSYVECLNCI